MTCLRLRAFIQNTELVGILYFLRPSKPLSNIVLYQDGDFSRERETRKPAPTRAGAMDAALGEDDLDSLLASVGSPAVKTRAPVNSDVVDLDLDDLLGAPEAPPQRFSGGGTVAGRGGRSGASRSSYDERDSRSSYDGGSSYGGGQEFGSMRGAFGADPEAAHTKAVKGDRMVSNVEVSDEGACAVADKDVDPTTVAALQARGIETFTPVQVGGWVWP